MTRTVRRILVALDPSEQGRRAATAAAEMAAHMQAEVLGVFVEDIDLLRMAALPFAQEFRPYASKGDRVEISSMERQLRGQATKLREEMARAAEHARVPWSFRVARGRVAQELLSAAREREADVVVVGRSATHRTRRLPVGSTARAVLSGEARTVVVLHRDTSVGRPVLVLFDGTRSSDNALSLAASLAREDHKYIVVALAAESPAEARVLAERADAVLSSLGLAARHVVLDSADPTKLLAMVRDEQCRTLVLGVESDILNKVGSSEIVERASCPVVLVR